MRAIYYLAIFVILAVTLQQADAGVIYEWSVGVGGNGHFYERVDTDPLSWGDARDAASALTYLGLPGHLVTVTSVAESNFLRDTIDVTPGDFAEFWMGGFQDTSAVDFSEPAGGWRWITGEPFVFTNWATLQPNNNGPLIGNPTIRVAENFLSTRSGTQFEWNDNQFAGVGIVGYVVEFEAAPVPEPSSIAVFAGLGAMGFLGYRWRRRK